MAQHRRVVRVASNSLYAIAYPGWEDPPPLFKYFLNKRKWCLYLLQKLPGGCNANCAYCNQARSVEATPEQRSWLCNYEWLDLELEPLLRHIQGLGGNARIDAICVQTIFHPHSFDDQLATVEAIRRFLPEIWISTATTPRTREQLVALKDAGVNGLCVCFEAATPELFDRIKGRGVNGPYRWRKQRQLLEDAREVFPRDTMTHLMIGLGETEREVVDFLWDMAAKEVGVSLFPFLPLEKTRLAEDPQGSGRPELARWRRLQLAHFLIMEAGYRPQHLRFARDRIVGVDITREELRAYVLSGRPFVQSGCKYCTRVGYAEEQKNGLAQDDLLKEPYVFHVSPDYFRTVLERIADELDLETCD